MFQTEPTKKCIGLFGTCGKSTWRERFITEYSFNNIRFYNPQLPDGTWTPDCAKEEAWHLANDEIIIFPITGETYGLGSLAETGYSVNQALKFDDRRDFVLFIEPDVHEILKNENPTLATESINMRALVNMHLSRLHYDNVHVVKDFDVMLKLSVLLWKQRRERDALTQEVIADV